MKITSYNSDLPPLDMPLRTLPSGDAATRPRPPLVDAMEEVAMKFSESVERNSKSLDARQIGTATASTHRVERVEKLAELYRLLDHTDQPSLEQQARRMQSMLQQSASLGALLQLTGNDPARTDIVLQQALRLSTNEGQDALAETARSSLESLRQAHGETIRAGVNTASAIALFSRDPQQRVAMRQLYYKAIVGQQAIASLLESLLERFGEEQFPRGLRTLQRALADDIAALAPSLPQGVLRAMLGGLGASGQLNNLLHLCRALLERLAQRASQGTMTPLLFGRRVLRFCGNGFFARDLSSLAEETLGRESNLQPLFFNGLYPLLQGLPVALWKDLKTRQNALRLMQSLMDEQARLERQALGLGDKGHGLP